MKLPFWKTDKRRVDKELLNNHLHLRITKSEDEFLTAQAEEQCRSKNSILRALLKKYKRKLDNEGKEEEH